MERDLKIRGRAKKRPDVHTVQPTRPQMWSRTGGKGWKRGTGRKAERTREEEGSRGRSRVRQLVGTSSAPGAQDLAVRYCHGYIFKSHLLEKHAEVLRGEMLH